MALVPRRVMGLEIVMARPLRVEYAGALYHVMNRGNRRERVFRKAADYELFLDRLGRFSAEFGVEVLSYCLMPTIFICSCGRGRRT